MTKIRRFLAFFFFIAVMVQCFPATLVAEYGSGDIVIPSKAVPLPREFSSYNDDHITSLWEKVSSRAREEPVNLIASIIFACAIIHMFFARKLYRLAYRLDEKHRKKHKVDIGAKKILGDHGKPRPVNFVAQILYFFGEVEVIFMIWTIPLALLIAYFYNWDTASCYINGKSFREPLFVVVIMALAATRPILNLAADTLHGIARFFNNTPMAWWFTILTVGPLLGSIITEPGAITISSILIARQFYRYNPTTKFAYATMGLLFVNISVGGVMTHFAAPPVLMVAHLWGWDTPFMFAHFGWKALMGILLSNTIYAYYFKKEFSRIKLTKTVQHHGDRLRHYIPKEDPVPLWITAVHIFVMFWTIYNESYPVVFIGMFLLFMGFHQATRPYQNELTLKPSVLIGCFLAGLIIHGGLQGWWIDPILDCLGERALLLSTVVMTAFNDNAAITYLSTFNTHFTDTLKYAVVAGAVAGGGLTVMANAPNPAGQLLLKKYFHRGVAPLYLFFGAALPTAIQVAMFMFLPNL
ncbi:MAG: hypothetical protein HN411_00560 [Waddliaceae bacterium]|jgi:hypothetical protein|nr:hypothetical protein [Waddliaceae bacterium]MBT3579475.1 hypothetical protein [Waddliaceae bacterium]MBT4445576.1 hypothetical protein [Waddliaceae bacterium]MBT6928232.1 hypothetical protein [Waddliaceae bacterium]MBT7264577.1 hypothetical protein [Waddliaceae bacterium]